MVRTTLPLLAVAAVVALFVPGTASGQTTLNQTTCVPTGGLSPQNCLDAAGFKQSITVTCPSSINNALASITDRNGPNRIIISGSCQQQVTVTGHNRLTFEGPATMTRGWSFNNSTTITLKSLTFDLATAPGQNISLNVSNVILDGTTIQNSQNSDSAVALRGNSTLSGSATAHSTITGNVGRGVDISAGSVFNALNITISNNQRQGIHVRGALNLLTSVGVLETPVDVSFNDNEGIETEGGIIQTFGGGSAQIHLHDNGGNGLSVGGGFANLEGNVLIENNGDGDTPGASDCRRRPVDVRGRKRRHRWPDFRLSRQPFPWKRRSDDPYRRCRARCRVYGGGERGKHGGRHDLRHHLVGDEFRWRSDHHQQYLSTRRADWR